MNALHYIHMDVKYIHMNVKLLYMYHARETHMALTPEQVKQKFRREGKTLKQFAEENGFPQEQVYRVMNGTIKGTRGRGHEIAVALGLKSASTW